MILVETQPARLSPATPGYQYRSMEPLWRRTRAVLEGESAVKALDSSVDPYNFSNLLIPFSPSMSNEQYAFYRSEAELPGLVGQYAKLLIGGLLRKTPQMTFSSKIPEEAMNWIENEFTVDDQSLVAFLDQALWTELASRAFIMVDFPAVADPQNLTKAQREALRPFPVLWRAEKVINWRQGVNPSTGKTQLLRVMLHDYVEDWSDPLKFHPDILEVVVDHRIDERGVYVVDKYSRKVTGLLTAEGGELRRSLPSLLPDTSDSWIKDPNTVTPVINDKPFNYIPGFFLDGAITPREPLLLPLVNREVSLYNKVSRRNHLLYTACTFTPVFFTDVTEDQFDEIATQGLGTFIRLNVGNSVTNLETPTAALSDLNQSIEMTVQELSSMGLRLMNPEDTASSGIALEIRNSAQTSQLATFNNKVSQTMRAIVSLMLQWRYDLELTADDVDFTLSTDFNTSPLGENWVRLVTEWYESGIVPRSLFLRVAKDNDIIPMDYNDDEGQTEIKEDPVRVPMDQGLALPDQTNV